VPWCRRIGDGLAILVGIIIASGALVAVAKISRIGPFKPVQQYPTAAAPSDPAQRLAYFQSGAKAGDANAELQLAILYAKGEGVAQDYATSATWFRAAANQGVARAQYDLGVMYERGRGVPVDLTQSADWYLKAAKGGYPLAQYNLAVCYTKGQGIRQDQTEAALWYHRAASQGVVQAMINLGMMYEKGDGVAVSPVDAYAWYLAAGRRDNQASAHRAEEIFNGLPRLDQVRADALASDVAASIHDPEPERDAATTGSSDAKPAAPTH
jgi:TPR repeat protein